MTAKHGMRITLLSLLLKTFSRALLEFPRMNCTYSLDKPFEYQTHPFQNVVVNSVLSDETLKLLLIRGLETMSVQEVAHHLSNTQDNQNNLIR